MARTSSASARRKLLGIEPDKDPVKQAAGLKGAASKHNKTEKQMLGKKKMSLLASMPRGGIKQIELLQAERDKLQALAKTNVRAIAQQNAESSVRTLVSLMNGSIEAPASVRRLAALDILQIAGADHESLSKTADQTPLEEMTVEQLHQFIAEGMETLKQAQTSTVEGEAVEIQQDDSL